jgi:hypothetical protein
MELRISLQYLLALRLRIASIKQSKVVLVQYQIWHTANAV